MKHVALMFSSRKGGHRFPALALQRELSRVRDPSLRVTTINLLDQTPLADRLDRLGRWGDLHVTQVWRSGYARLSRADPVYTGLFRRFLTVVLANHASRRRWRSTLGTTDLIVSLQPEVNCIARWLKREFNVPIHTVVMDYIPHAGWTDPRLDYYYAGNEMTRDRLIGYGVPAGRIKVTGAPVQPGFENVMRTPVNEHRRRLNLDPILPTMLLMAGYLGTMVDYLGIIKALAALNRPLQILVVTGRNQALYRALQQQHDPRLRLYYDVPSIHTVMWASDLVISKPGGMVIADSLTLGKPMILIDPRAGSLQEVLFADLVEQQGAAIHLRDASQIGPVVRSILDDHERLRRMAEKARLLGTANRTAAAVITDHIVRRLTVNKPGLS